MMLAASETPANLAKHSFTGNCKLRTSDIITLHR